MFEQPNPSVSSDFLASLLKASPFAIVCLDLQGLVRFWNETAETTFGYRAAEVFGQPLPIVPADCADDYAERFERAVSGEKCPPVRLRRRRKDGTLIDVRASGVPLHDKNGNVRGVVYTLEDITDRVTLEEALRQAYKMEAIGQLTGGVAHDFNNLLGVITMNLDLLADDIHVAPDVQELIDTAQTAAFRGAELIHQLLAFSRQQPLHPKSVDLNAIVENLERMLQRTLGETIKVTTRKADGLWNAHVDTAQLENAVLNLAINARDAMDDGGVLLIETANAEANEAGTHGAVLSGPYVKISVTDTGTGIPPELVERVFEPFFTTKLEGKGTGLGLSMVYGFVKQSNGHIRIDGASGQGTSVTLYLPCAESDAVAEVEPKAAPISAAGEMILVVEDAPAVRQSAVRLLTGLGYRTLEAATAPEALEILGRQGRVDLVFTDIVMPGGMSGLELVAEVGYRWPGTGILCTSGYAESFARAADTDETRVQFLMKPYRKHELAMAVKTALGK